MSTKDLNRFHRCGLIRLDKDELFSDSINRGHLLFAKYVIESPCDEVVEARVKLFFRNIVLYGIKKNDRLNILALLMFLRQFPLKGPQYDSVLKDTRSLFKLKIRLPSDYLFYLDLNPVFFFLSNIMSPFFGRKTAIGYVIRRFHHRQKKLFNISYFLSDFLFTIKYGFKFRRLKWQ